MGRQPCCDKVGLKKGPWTAEEDKKLINFILTNGQCCWRAVPKLAGLLRCGKSCRLRWTNYLRPDLKRGLLSEYEEKMVIELHSQLGNRWSKIASRLPGRTDNEIKNHWNTHIKKKLRKMGIDPLTHKPLPPPTDDQQPQEEEVPPSLSNNCGITEMDDQNKEIETTSILESTITNTEAREEDNKISNASSPYDLSSREAINNGFCTDEVPLIEPHEINLIPISASSSSSSSTYSINGSSDSSNNSILEELQFLPTFDWQLHYDYTTTTTNNNNVGFWDIDAFSSLDNFLINDHPDSDRNVTTVQPPLAQYSRMVLDEESWKFHELL